MSRDVLKQFTDSVDLKNLETSIVKSVEGGAEPFNKEVVMMVCDIAELKPFVE